MRPVHDVFPEGVRASVILYASRTGTKANLALLRKYGWHLLVSARGVLRDEGFPYALDNGAWTAFVNKEPFDVPAFEAAVEKMGRRAEWVVCPDVVGDQDGTLQMARTWVQRLRAFPTLVAVQDGMSWESLAGLGDLAGVFIGGTTEWKLATLRYWSAEARARGLICHVGRVNTPKRARLCADAGATSCDGSGPSRFGVTIKPISNAVLRAEAQGSLF